MSPHGFYLKNTLSEPYVIILQGQLFKSCARTKFAYETACRAGVKSLTKIKLYLINEATCSARESNYIGLRRSASRQPSRCFLSLRYFLETGRLAVQLFAFESSWRCCLARNPPYFFTAAHAAPLVKTDRKGHWNTSAFSPSPAPSPLFPAPFLAHDTTCVAATSHLRRPFWFNPCTPRDSPSCQATPTRLAPPPAPL